MAWLTGWSYREAFKISLASGGPLTDYTVVISIDTTGLIADDKMQADGDDIRFTQGATETLLSYWLEPGTINTTTTKIWIKINTIPDGKSGIWMYYGNASAAAYSDITGIFLEYDLFDDASIDPAKWTTLSGNGSITESSNQLNFAYTTTEANDWWGTGTGREGKVLRLDTTPGVDFFVQILIPSGITGPANYFFGIAAYQDDANVYHFGRIEAGVDRIQIQKIVGGTGSSVTQANYRPLPRYYGIKKTGSEFRFFDSTDGVSWTQFGGVYSDITFNKVVLWGKEYSASGTNLTFKIKDLKIRKAASVEPAISFLSKNILVHAGAVASLNDYWQDGPNPFFYEDSTNIIYAVISLGTAGGYLDVVKSIDEGISWNIFLTLTNPSGISGVYRTPSGNEWQLKNNKLYGVVANAAERITFCFYLVNLTSETEERKITIFNEGFNPGMFPRAGVGFTITDDGKLWASYTWLGFLDGTYPAGTILVVSSEDEGQNWGISLQVNATGGRGNTKLFSETNAVVLIHNWKPGTGQGIFKTYVSGGGSDQDFLTGTVTLRDVIQYGTSYIYSYESGGSWYTGIDTTAGIQIGSGEGPIYLAIGPDGIPRAVTKTSNTQISLWNWNGTGWDLIATYTTTSTDDNGSAIGNIRRAYLLYHQYDQTKQGDGKEIFYITTDASPENVYALYEASLWSFLPAAGPPQGPRPLFAPCGPDPEITPRPLFWPFNGSQESLLALDLQQKPGIRTKSFGGYRWDKAGAIGFKSYQKYGQLFLEGAFAVINTPDALNYPDGSEPTARPYGADIWRFYNDRKGSLLPFFTPEFFPRPHLLLTSATVAGAIDINLASVVGLTIEDGAEGNMLAISRPERNIFDVVGISTIVGMTITLDRALAYSYTIDADIFIVHKVIFDQPLKVRQVHRFVDYFEMRFRSVGACNR